MPSVSYDGQSFTVDGRRVWLVSGSIHYPRVPRELWRDRIRAAKQAGLNCIDTSVFWALHEPKPGRFVFEGDLDLRAFVQLVGEEGLYCILRPGPYVGADWDLGGLPAWLLRTPGIKLRQAHPPFLEACARYLGAVMEQVRDLQVTASSDRLPPSLAAGHAPGEAAGGFAGPGGGPIILMQIENEWLCHNQEQADLYLRELARYLRENGCEVPISNANNLWQRVEGTIDTWNAHHRLLSDLRQLAVVQPHAPRLVAAYRPGQADTWGRPHADSPDPDLLLHRLAQVLASGAQYNLAMFHGGTNFAFRSGRSIDRRDAFITTSYDNAAPLREGGGRGPHYLAVKRISTFASQFHQLFAHLELEPPHAAVTLDEENHPLSVVHLRGSQGQVVFLFAGRGYKPRNVSLVLPNGLTLPVTLGPDRVAWLLLKTNLGGLAQLEYTNLRPWAFVQRRMLVLFGPPGSEGLVCLDDVPLQLTVPTGREPLVEHHEDLTIVVLNTQQVDAAVLCPQGLAVGASGLDEEDQPVPMKGWPQLHLVSLDGELTHQSQSVARLPRAPRLGGWTQALQTPLVDGSAESYEPIEGPTSLEELGCGEGYGWYRISLGRARRGKVMAPLAADRLHLYSKGKLQGVLGWGPGASDESVPLTLSNEVVILADNLGHFSAGIHLDQRKGLYGHLYLVKSLRLGKPQMEASRAPDPFVLSGYVPGRRKGEHLAGDSLTWTIKAAGSHGWILDVRDLPLAGMFLLDQEPLGYYNPVHSAGMARFVIEPGEGQSRQSRRQLRLSLFSPLRESIRLEDHLKLYQVTQVISRKGPWAFARWSMPEAQTFGKPQQMSHPQPAWYRCEFLASRTGVPLWLEPRGMSKGQIFLNGRNVGRYFVATAQGTPTPPQKLYYLPDPWLYDDRPNELVLFDEHGMLPQRVRLVYNPMGPHEK